MPQDPVPGASGQDDLAEIRRIYAGSAEYTWNRHVTDSRIEGEVLRRALEAELPQPPACIADIGGGNGRWAYYLAGLGYQVLLSDVTPELIADAERRAPEHPALERAEVADARCLPYASGSVDGCLVLGPMYSLPAEADRAAALSEVRRVLRPGGIALIQYLTRMAGLRSILTYAAAKTGEFDWRGFIEHGRFSDSRVPRFYRANTWMTEEEAVAGLRQAGLLPRTILGMDGPAPGTGQEALADAPAELVGQWADIAMAIGTTPAGRAAADHILVIAYKDVA
jgi:SAM-dependent methyltransferase